jgi:hypothetical protein
MTQVEMSDEQVRTLREILNGYLAGFPSELYGADHFSFGSIADRVHKKEVIEDLVERIEKAA